MAEDKVTQKVTAPATTAAAPAAKKFTTVVEEAPKPKAPALNEKTRAEMAAGRAVLDAYRPAQSED